MPAYYTYLISSLPLLLWGGKPSFSFEDFIRKCRGLIPESAREILRKSSVAGEYPKENTLPVTLKKWYGFDTALRNELVKLRSAHKLQDPLKYTRIPRGSVDYSMTRIAMAAHRNPAILEGERFLDQQRWCFLDELALGHYFDLDFLLVYALKLLILERWERINSADKSRLLEEALQTVNSE